MIEVKRTDHQEIVRRSRKTGEVIEVIPARYECSYRYNGREIAHYYSRDDTMALMTDLIGHDFKKSVYERAITCKHKDAYIELFQMLGIDRTTHLTEYSYM